MLTEIVGDKSNTCEERSCRQNKESEAKRKFPGASEDKSLSASRIASHSVVYKEAEGGRVLD